ncbi:MAG: T9SS type A sorting domain-containing protein [Bacteroidia bacterium]
MKLIFTLITACALSGALLAQQADINMPFGNRIPAGNCEGKQIPSARISQTGNPSTAAAYHQWLYPSGTTMAGKRVSQFNAYLAPTFQDSSVKTVFASGTSNVWMMKAGGTLDPYSTKFSPNSLATGNGYTLDTVWIGGHYEIHNATIGDTLYVEVSWGPIASSWYAHLTKTTPVESFYTSKNVVSTTSGNTSPSAAPLNYSAILKHVFTAADSFAPNHLAYKFYPLVPTGGPIWIAAGNVVAVQYTFVPKAAYSAGATYFSGVSPTAATMNSFLGIQFEDSLYTATSGASGHQYFYDANGSNVSSYYGNKARYGKYTGAQAGLNGVSLALDNDGFAWAVSISSSLVTSTEEMNAYGLSLSQNIPNPFNGNTEIAYELGNNSDVVFSVYDISGRIVMEQKEGTQAAGKHTISLNASSFTKGIYFYSVKANGSSLSRKMIISE